MGNSKFKYMQVAPEPGSNQIHTPFFQKEHVQYSAVFLLLLLAFGIRLFHITGPPLDFSPIRQYQSIHIARGIYFENNASIDEQERRIAELNMQRMGLLLEPRVLENAAVLGYRAAGEELLWIPRTLSVVFWTAGGLFLFLIARRISSIGESLFTLSFYLFLPYSILASRCFQPDPLMLMMLLASIYTVLAYHDRPSILLFLVSAATTSLAIYIKPYSLFMIWIVFISVSIHKKGFRKTILSPHAFLFIFLSFIPAFFQYVYGMFTNVGFLQQHARGSFLPYLMLEPSFWKGWLNMLGKVTGYIAFILAAAGLVTARKGMPKTLLTGLWAGYFLFGLSATYQTHTHSYYHIPFIPIAALSLGPMGAGAVKLLIKKWHLPLVFIVILAVSGAVTSKERLKSFIEEHKNELRAGASVIGVNPRFKDFLAGRYEDEIRIAEEIGAHVEHSTNTIFLTPAFGRIIAYHGKFAGLPWPNSESLYARKVRGAQMPDIEKDFAPDHIIIGFQGKLIEYTPDFFIVTDFQEFETQSDLRKYLTENFPLLVKNEDYMIFDMRKMSK
jgi:hypothetical protein